MKGTKLTKESNLLKNIINSKSNSGVTLIALIIMIIIILILAGVSIKMLTGDDDAIKGSIIAKDLTEIDNEKEMINMSVAQAIGKTTARNITKDMLQSALNRNLGAEEATVVENGDKFSVTFNKTNRTYEVTQSGGITLIE